MIHSENKSLENTITTDTTLEKQGSKQERVSYNGLNIGGKQQNSSQKDAIRIESLEKQYVPPSSVMQAVFGKSTKGDIRKKQHALKDVSLNIKQGCIYGLLGPNGAGKSTLINILSGLSDKTSGRVFINGINQDEEPVKTRYQIGVVPQEVVLDPFFKVAEMLEFYAGLFSVPKHQRRTDEIIEALGLSDKRHSNPRRLSGGMKRRLLIAKALVHNPSIIILDEPTAGVDVELRSRLWEYVRKLNKEHGVTILLTTHYLEEAEELCDYIGIINHGRVITEGKKQDIMANLDRKSLVITTDKPVKESSIKPLEDVNFQVNIKGENLIEFIFKKGEIQISDIIDKVKQLGFIITDITTKEPDLEDVFRFLVVGRDNFSS